MSKLNFYFAVVGLSSFALLGGCGGSGKNPDITQEPLTSTGTVSSTVGSLSAPIGATTEATPVTVGGADVLLMPAGEALPAATPVSVVGIGTMPLGPIDTTTALTRGPIGAYVWKDGQARTYYPSLMTRDGLTRNIGFTPGKWHLELVPCYVYKIADPSNRMTVNKLLFNFVVDANGDNSIPRVTGRWVRDGATLTTANYATAFVNKAFLAKPCKLTITTPTQSITKSLAYGAFSATEVNATFVDAFNPSLQVPAGGLTLVEYTSGY